MQEMSMNIINYIGIYKSTQATLDFITLNIIVSDTCQPFKNMKPLIISTDRSILTSYLHLWSYKVNKYDLKALDQATCLETSRLKWTSCIIKVTGECSAHACKLLCTPIHMFYARDRAREIPVLETAQSSHLSHASNIRAN